MNEQLWMKKKEWENNQIFSGAKASFILMWVFAGVWNVVLIPMYFQISVLIEKAKSEPLVYAAGIFPVVGLYLLFLAIKHTRDWLALGRTPLVLDPFPGSIGAHVGGRIDTNLKYEHATQANVTIQCIYSRITGSGKNRRRTESVKWQNSGASEQGQSARGIYFQFRFNVPDGLPESDVSPKSSSYYLWRITLEVTNAGKKILRSFEIPVFQTSEQSSSIRSGTEDHEGTMAAAESGVDSVANIRAVGRGLEIFYPAFRRPAASIFIVLFGAVFIGIGVALMLFDASMVLGIIFPAIGALCLVAGIYGLGKSLLVSVTNEEVSTRRFLFGYPIYTRRILRENLKGYEINDAGSMTSGGKTTVFYNLQAVAADGKKYTVAERHTSRPEIELIKSKLELVNA